MNYKVTLTPPQMQALAGILDAAVKAIGLRAVKQDFVDVVLALESAQLDSPPPPAAPPETPPQDS